MNTGRVFEIALEVGREWKLCLRELRLFNVKISQVSMTCVYIKPEV